MSSGAWVAKRLSTRFHSSRPLLLENHFLPQHANNPATLSLPFHHYTFAHWPGAWAPLSCLAVTSGYFMQAGPWGPKLLSGCLSPAWPTWSESFNILTHFLYNKIFLIPLIFFRKYRNVLKQNKWHVFPICLPIHSFRHLTGSQRFMTIC